MHTNSSQDIDHSHDYNVLLPSGHQNRAIHEKRIEQAMIILQLCQSDFKMIDAPANRFCWPKGTGISMLTLSAQIWLMSPWWQQDVYIVLLRCF